MGSNRLARQSFGMLQIVKTIYFLSCSRGRRKEKDGRKKKEDEQNKNFRVWFFRLSKVSGTFGVDIALE